MPEPGERRLRPHERYQSIHLVLRSVGSREDVFDEVVREVLRSTRASISALVLHDPAADALRVVGYASREGRELVTKELPRGQGLSWEVLERNAPRYVSDVQRAAGARFLSGAPRAGTYLGVPLQDLRGNAVGVLTANTTDGGELGPGDRYYLEVLAQATGATLERLQALEEARREGERFLRLAELSGRLETLDSEVEIAREFLTAMLELTQLEGGAFLRLGSDGRADPAVAVGEFPPGAYELYRRHPIGPETAPLWRRLERGESVYVPDYGTWEGALPLLKEVLGVRTVLVEPVRREGALHGALLLCSLTRVVPVPQEVRSLLEMASRRVERAVERALQLEELRRSREAEREQARRYRSLAELSARLEDLDDPHAIAREGIQAFLALTGLQVGILYERRGERLEPALHVGDAPQALLEHAPVLRGGAVGGLLQRTFETRAPAIVADYQTWEGAAPALAAMGLRTAAAAPLVLNGAFYGIMAVGRFDAPTPLPAEATSLFHATARRIERALERSFLFEELRGTREQALRVVGLTLEYRDYETKGHTDRVSLLASRLGRAMGLGPEALQHLQWGSYLHDTGKIAIPDQVLLKPSRLTREEFALIQTHVVIGEAMLRELDFLPPPVLRVVRNHHERWDGTGYPDGLAGDDIPLLCRLFAVIDVYDALTSERPYKRAWTHEEAIAEIAAQRGRQFAPDVVDAFLALREEGRALPARASGGAGRSGPPGSPGRRS